MAASCIGKPVRVDGEIDEVKHLVTSAEMVLEVTSLDTGEDDHPRHDKPVSSRIIDCTTQSHVLSTRPTLHSPRELLQERKLEIVDT